MAACTGTFSFFILFDDDEDVTVGHGRDFILRLELTHCLTAKIKLEMKRLEQLKHLRQTGPGADPESGE
jgi:hypothetical protein